LKRDQQEGIVHPDQIDPKKQGGISKILLLYVYDMLIVGKKEKDNRTQEGTKQIFCYERFGWSGENSE